MKVAIIGASGFIGSRLLAEAVARGHQVSALVSNPERISGSDKVKAVKADVQDSADLASKIEGYDAVISAFSGHAQPDTLAYYLKGFESLLGAARRAKVARLLVVGGAGSLEVAPGLQAIDTPQFPAE